MPLGWPGLFAEKMFAVWILDFILAFGIGTIFQYFAIAPMRNLRPLAGLKVAIKADTLSLISCQLGAMAIAVFAIYRPLFGTEPDASSSRFLVHHAVCDDCRLYHCLPDELVADSCGRQGKDVKRVAAGACSDSTGPG